MPRLYNEEQLQAVAAAAAAVKSSIYIYRVSQEECARLQEGVPYGKGFFYLQFESAIRIYIL
jgi:hypothetical protein